MYKSVPIEWAYSDCIKKAKLVEGLASYMYENFLEIHTLFISPKAVDSPCNYSQKLK